MSGLSEAEQHALAIAVTEWGYTYPPPLFAAAERIVAARLAPIEAERDRLLSWKQEARTLFDGLQDLGRALGVPLGVLITGPIAIEAAENLRGTLGRVGVSVEELCPHAADEHAEGTCEVCDYAFALGAEIEALRTDPSESEAAR